MDHSKANLLKIPDLVMRKILDDCDFVAILNLRKTCHSLRNFIDDVTPQSTLHSIFIEFNQFHVSWDLKFSDSKTICLKYFETENGCTIVWDRNDRKSYTRLKNAENLKIFSNDLGEILKNPSIVLGNFKISMKNPPNLRKKNWKILKFFGCVWPEQLDEVDYLIEALENRPRPLEVKFFEMKIYDLNQFSKIFPFIEAEKCLIKNSKINNLDFGKLDIQEASGKLSIEGFLVNVSILEFMNLEKLFMAFREVTVEELVILKETFLNSTNHKKHFRFYSQIFQNENCVISTFGLNFTRFGRLKTWIFEISDRKYALFIENEDHWFNFRFIKKATE